MYNNKQFNTLLSKKSLIANCLEKNSYRSYTIKLLYLDNYHIGPRIFKIFYLNHDTWFNLNKFYLLVNIFNEIKLKHFISLTQITLILFMRTNVLIFMQLW